MSTFSFLLLPQQVFYLETRKGNKSTKETNMLSFTVADFIFCSDTFRKLVSFKENGGVTGAPSCTWLLVLCSWKCIKFEVEHGFCISRKVEFLFMEGGSIYCLEHCYNPSLQAIVKFGKFLVVRRYHFSSACWKWIFLCHHLSGTCVNLISKISGRN